VQKKDVLLHCIVHDLKAPLSSIVGALSLLSTTELDREKTAALLEIGLRQARRQKELIRQVLDVFAAEIRDIEAFELDPKRAPDVARCGREGVENYRPVYAEKGVELVWDPGPFAGGEARVVGAYDRLERALVNLLENALRFSPEDSRTEVSLREEGLDVVLSVSDRGPGVDRTRCPTCSTGSSVAPTRARPAWACTTAA
jgi:signal transduction histidine kinase